MKKTIVLAGVAFCLLLGTLSGCKANVDLSQIDPSMEANMGLALPIGEISATIGDFIGNDNVAKYIRVRNDGVLFFEDTFKISRTFYDIDLTQYVTNAEKRFKVGDLYGGLPVQQGKTYELRFPLSIKLNNVNTAAADGSYQERIDSIWVRAAQFTSSFTVANFGLPYSDIQKLEIVLDKNFSRAEGSVLEIPLTGSDYGEDIPITVDEFTLNLMKNRNAAPSNVNVVNEVNFEFVFTIVPSSDMFVNTDAAIDFNFNINFLEYHAIWGWFRPSKYMRGSDTIILAEEWPMWSDLQDFMLPLAEPTIQLDLYNSIGMPLMVDGEYLFVESLLSGDKCYAEFDGSLSWSWPLQNFVHLNEDISTVVKNTYTFSNDPSHGAIDKLFGIHPDLLGYSYNVYPNNSKAEASGIKHYRLSEDTDIDIDAILNVPFTFHPGVNLSYTDTIDSINIEAYQMDSLIAELEMLEQVAVNELKLILQTTNTIPFDVVGEFVFVDAAGQAIDIQLTDEGNKIKIAGPSEVENGVVTTPGSSTIIIDVDQATYDKLTQLKQVLFKVSLGDNTTYVRLLDKSGLKIRLAVAANVKAGLNLDALFNNDNEEVIE